MRLTNYRLNLGGLTKLKRLFEHATTFGSLIQVPVGLAEKLPALKQLSEATSQDLFVSEAIKRLGPLVQQAELLAAQYDSVVANPPYMGGRNMNPQVKSFAGAHFPDAKSDLFACFIERGFTLTKDAGHNAMVTMQSWMFLSSFEKMRTWLLRAKTIGTMAHLGARAFGSISGEVVQTAAFVLKNRPPQTYKPVFFRLLNGGEEDKRLALASGEHRFDEAAQDEFKKVPGSPVAYWASGAFRALFESNENLGSKLTTRQGLATGDNNRFVRVWQEVCIDSISPSSDNNNHEGKWAFFISGGKYRKWHGNVEWVVNWENDGLEIRNNKDPNGRLRSRPQSMSFYFKENIVCAALTSGDNAFRYSPPGTIFDVNVRASFAAERGFLVALLAVLNSPVMRTFSAVLSPTLALNIKELELTPLPATVISEPVILSSLRCVNGAKQDWDAYERSWDFQSLPLLTASSEPTPTLESCYTVWIAQNRDTITEMKHLEEENNRLFIDAYGLGEELTPDVPIEQITLTVNPAYRYGGKADPRGTVDPLPPGQYGGAGLLRHRLHDGSLQPGYAGFDLRPQRQRRL